MTLNNTFSANFVPERLKEGREARGLTIQELAEKVGVSHQAISKYENGKSTPSGLVLQKLSLVLNLPLYYFSKPINRASQDKVVFFRSRAAATVRSKKVHASRIGWLQDIYMRLEEFLDFPKYDVPRFNTSAVYVPMDLDEIDDIAVKVRKHWGLGSGPISNVLLLVEKKGVIVSRANFDDQKIDACSKWQDDRAFILLGSDKSAVRSRFDVAHELGHLVLHSGLNPNEFHKNLKAIENEANRFASAFLMPVESFSSEFISTSIDYLINMKRRWKVSIQAMAFRARELDLISEFQYRNIMRKMAQNNWRKNEPLDDHLPLEQPTALKQAFELIIQQNVVSKSDIERYMGFTKRELEIYANLKPGTLSETTMSDTKILQFKKKNLWGT